MRKSIFGPLVLTALILLPAVIPLAAEANDGLDRDALATEIDRLGTLVNSLANSLAKNPNFGDAVKHLRSTHQEAVEALQHGQLHRALQRLQSGLVLSSSYQFLVDQKHVTDLAGFEKLWQELGQIPRRSKLAGNAPSCQRAPSQVRALVETAANRASRHYRASMAMARANGPSSGLFYLGQARVEVDLARFCTVFQDTGFQSTVSQDKNYQHPEPSALSRDLASLEDATAVAYAVPGAAIDQHSKFIGLNASLKEIGELLDAGLHFGAFDRFLEATLRLSLIEENPAEPPAASETRQRLDRLIVILADHGGDHSIALAYLERAAMALDDPEAEDTDRVQAERIVDRVLPAYLDRMGVMP